MIEKFLLKAQICFDEAKFEDAINYATEALAYNQNSPSAYQIIGASFYKLNRFEESKKELLRAAFYHTKEPQVFQILGEIAMKECDFKNSAIYFLKAYELSKHIEFLNNAGLAYLRNYEFKRAQEIFLQIIDLNPNYCNAYINLASTFAEQNQNEMALKIYKEIQKIENCNKSIINWNMALIYLKLFDFENGWPLYKSRYDLEYPKKLLLPNTKKRIPKSLDECKNKILFLYHEQGFGDMIMVFRFLVPLSKIAKKIYLKIKEPLFPLISMMNLYNEIILIKPDESLDEELFDLHIPMMDLPALFETNDKNCILKDGYIKTKKAKIEHKKTLIGIVYESISAKKDCFFRKNNIPLDEFQEILELDFDFLLLSPDLQLNHKNLLPKPEIKDFKDTAKLIETCDLVISIDTSVAHLAGAMGKECYILLSFYNDWRWGLESQESYWYKSVKLFRQKEPNNWKEPINRIRECLLSRLKKQ